MRKRLWWPMLWACWIFATSRTVIARPSFIRAIGNLLPQGAAQQEWSWVWMSFGLIVIKTYHVSEYAVLCTLIFGALRWRGVQFERAVVGAPALALLFAASDEWHQTFVPGRGGTWVDVCIDFLGIGLATGLILSRAHRKAKSPALGT